MKPLFVSADDSLLDWRFRWQLDRYVCSFIGFCCVLYIYFNALTLLFGWEESHLACK